MNGTKRCFYKWPLTFDGTKVDPTFGVTELVLELFSELEGMKLVTFPLGRGSSAGDIGKYMKRTWRSMTGCRIFAMCAGFRGTRCAKCF